MTASRRSVASALWWEWHRELGRQAGDERLPADVRVGLRRRAQVALARADATRSVPAPFPRRAIRNSARVELPGEPRGELLRVAIETSRYAHRLGAAVSWLLATGYQIASVDALTMDRSAVHGVLRSARFLVCESLDLQRAAYATHTPTLLLNASDPFSAYPVRPDGLFTIATPIDLDTGEEWSLLGTLTERYFRDIRNVGFRANTPSTVLAAVQEMHEGITHGWHEDQDQAQFRSRVVESGGVLASRVPLVAEWGPDAGFIGDGRLARVQAALQAGTQASTVQARTVSGAS